MPWFGLSTPSTSSLRSRALCWQPCTWRPLMPPSSPGWRATIRGASTVCTSRGPGRGASLWAGWGVEHRLYLEVAGERVESVAAMGDDELEPPAAFVVSFPLGEAQRRVWQEGAEVTGGGDASSVSSRVHLSADQRWALAGDF